MPPSADPLRLIVIDRAMTVLEAILAGDEYFYTPYMVKKILIPYEKAKSGPLYMPLPDTGEPIEYFTSEDYDEVFTISIHGVVHNKKDIGAAVEKAVNDVRKAIYLDGISGTANTLGTLCVDVNIKGSPEFDYFEDFGFFAQPIEFRISGNLSEL